MVTKQTFAIIGAAGKMGSAIARKLAKGNYRLLLFDIDPAVTNVAQTIAPEMPGSDIEIIQCSAEACWESDLIIFTMPVEAERPIAEHMVEYANQKIIISISEDDDQLANLLPHSKIVKTLNRINVQDIDAEALSVRVPVTCNDQDVFELVAALVETIGFIPVRKVVS